MSDEFIPAADLLEEQGFPAAAQALRERLAGRASWVWMPHPAHYICSYKCRFHLATFIPGKGRVVGHTRASGVIVSTVGEYWPERDARVIHATHYDPGWLASNQHHRGDDFDRAYMERFGFQEVSAGRLYETMVFPARKGKQACCPYKAHPLDELEMLGSNDSGGATVNHYQLCEEWAAKVAP